MTDATQRPKLDRNFFNRPPPPAILAETQSRAYIPGEKLPWFLNQLVGPNGWEIEYGQAAVVDCRERTVIDADGNKKHTHTATAWATATLTLHGADGPVRRGGLGADTSFHPNPGDAMDTALKSAATSAMKRAAQNFGRLLGGELGGHSLARATAEFETWAEAQRSATG